MARINLLPWREKLRRQKQRDFGVMTIIALLLTVAGMGYWHWFNEGLIDHQRDRNRYLEKEIAKVDKEIEEIKELEKTRRQLIARMKVIENLQVSRPQVVHLFDEMVVAIPDGAYLTKLTQQGKKLVLEGKAQSNARVSTYMRNIHASDWLARPKLGIIQTSDKDRERSAGSTFKLDLKQVAPKREASK